MAHLQPPSIPGEWDLRDRDVYCEGVIPCSCGNNDEHPFKVECRKTEVNDVLEYVRLKEEEEQQNLDEAEKKQTEANSEPPTKRRRTAAPDDREKIANQPQSIVVCRVTLVLFDHDAHEEGNGIKEYIYTYGNVRTHVAMAAKSNSKVRLVVSGCLGDTNSHYPVDVMVKEWAADFDTIEMAGKISHIQWGDRQAGKFWTETTFRALVAGGSHRLEIFWDIKWNVTTNLEEHTRHAPEHKYILDWMIKKLLPGHSLNSKITPQDFYRSIYTPQKDDPVAAELKVGGMGPELYGYQKRSARWMLNREGVDWSIATNSLIPIPKGMLVDILHKCVDAHGHMCWVSPLNNLVTTSRDGFANADINGGLLLEEMGLGKTIEIMSLILLHQRPLGQAATIFDQSMSADVMPIPATLIICPPAILKQWEEELDTHAPNLNVFTYKGINGHKNMKIPDLAKHVAIQDVVLTTYNVIGKEVHFLKPPPPRNLRSRFDGTKPRREANISPLVKFSWWRTILDEVQMIEGGMSNAAHVARLIPRVNAWGVTGTPVKNDISGMHSLLDFLRYEPFSSDKAAWKALLTRDSTTFKAICASIAIRHTKQMVRNEMTLPPQKRYVLRMPFSKIEEQHYQLLFSEGCREAGLSESGEPLRQDEKSSGGHSQEFKLQRFLRQLRINTLYPDANGVGPKKRQQNGAEPQTQSDLLHQMLIENLTEMYRSERDLLHRRIDRGKLHACSFGVKDPETALELWLAFSKEADDAEKAARAPLKKACDDDDAAEAVRSSNPVEARATINQSDVLKAHEILDAHGAHWGRMRDLQHTVAFLCGNGFFALKEKARPEEKEQYQGQEDAFYNKAKKIRQAILNQAYEKCAAPMKKLENKLDKDVGERGGFQDIPRVALQKSGTLRNVAADVAHMVDNLCMFLEKQRDLIMEWRNQTVVLLCRSLVDAHNDNDQQAINGDEYEQSAKDQEQLVVYVQAVRALVEDRNDILTGTRNALILTEMRDSLYQANHQEGPAPAKVKELAHGRSDLLRQADGVTFPDIQAKLRTKIGELKTAANKENRAQDAQRHALLQQWLPKFREFVAQQVGVISALRAECAEFTKLMNHRVEYYRQLQQISDLVKDWDGYFKYPAMSKDEVLAHMIQKEHDVQQRIAQLRTKRRYLEHIGDPEVANGLPECLICTDEYEDGAMTVCGHSFCRDCLTHWWQAHRTCPMCKRQLKRVDIHFVTHKPKELKVQEEKATPSRISHMTRSNVAQGIFSEVSRKSLNEIMNIPLPGPDLTTKVDTLCRHIIWLKRQDPTTKCLVFSQFTGFLEYLKRAFAAALHEEGIKWSSISDKNGIQTFKTDPDCMVFLLDAKSQSSGLNLVEASHVFLCEPLINTAIELQAISRVDRIGQKKETTVWLYVVDGTVEENIYDISVRRRLEHLSARPRADSGEVRDAEIETALEAENSTQLALTGSIQKLLDSKDKSAGENVSGDDLMEALFANRRQSVNHDEEEDVGEGEEAEEGDENEDDEGEGGGEGGEAMPDLDDDGSGASLGQWEHERPQYMSGRRQKRRIHTPDL